MLPTMVTVPDELLMVRHGPPRPPVILAVMFLAPFVDLLNVPPVEFCSPAAVTSASRVMVKPFASSVSVVVGENVEGAVVAAVWYVWWSARLSTRLKT